MNSSSRRILEEVDAVEDKCAECEAILTEKNTCDYNTNICWTCQRKADEADRSNTEHIDREIQNIRDKEDRIESGIQQAFDMFMEDHDNQENDVDWFYAADIDEMYESEDQDDHSEDICPRCRNYLEAMFDKDGLKVIGVKCTDPNCGWDINHSDPLTEIG